MGEQQIIPRPGNCPCRGVDGKCEGRVSGCHSTCKKYLDWVDAHTEYKSIINDLRLAERRLVSPVAIKNHNKAIRKKH